MTGPSTTKPPSLRPALAVPIVTLLMTNSFLGLVFYQEEKPDWLMRRVWHNKRIHLGKGTPMAGNGGVAAFITDSRKDRLIHERIHDPYKTGDKPPEPSVCPVCKAVFKGGHWQWLKSWPMDSPTAICPACRRIRDNYPAGVVTMSGDFIRRHRQEIVNLARRHEKEERALHPLHRIISIEEHTDTVTVATTDIHLPKRIGQALHRAYKGSLNLHYEKECCFVRVNWIAGEERHGREPIPKKRR